MDNLLISKLDKSKVYCYNCFKDGIINELSIDSSLEFCVPCENHKNLRSKFRLQFDNDEFKVFRGIVFGNRPQSEVNKDVYQSQKENKTGWCSKDAIYKKNSSENNSIRQMNAALRGNKLQSVKTQMSRGLHPSQNLNLQSKKVLIMNLRKAGINVSFNDIMDINYLDYFKLLPLKVDGKLVSYEDAFVYDGRCGSIGLTGVFKGDGKRYALNAGKSVNLGNEIRKFWRILSCPEKQEIDFDYGRWFNIANNYSDFEVLILCVDTFEEEALLIEMKWAVANDAIFKYTIDESGNKVQQKNTHGYWM